MKRALICIVTLIAGCQSGPVLMAYKPGTDFQQRQFEYDQCKIASLQQIPQALTTQVSGGYYNPGTVQCHTIGNTVSCNRVGQVNIPPTSSTYDVNEGLRGRFMDRCMTSKGYTLIERPICQDDGATAKALYDPQPASAAEVTCSAGVPLDG